MHRSSKVALLVCYGFILLTGIFYYPKWNQPATEATISWDVSGYYMYLPAAFIYQDLKQCKFKDSILQKYKPTPDFQQAFLHSSGHYVMKYPMGQAILLSPFFFVAHAYALVSRQYPADGFSYPYQFTIGLGMLLYSFIALWFLRKILLAYFSDGAVAVTLVVTCLATNYFNYASIDGAMTHNSLFFLYTMLLYVTIKFYQKPSLVLSAGIGVITGLATITRPTEIICLLLPLLWGIGNRNELKRRIVFLCEHKSYLLISLVLFCSICFFQLAYWKWVSGEWIIYSYQKQGFDFLRPHISDGLFSFRAGWLVYSPVMILSLIGFITLFRKQRQLFFPVFIFFVLFIYLCFSWEEWWYAGSLGQRAMIQSYPVLAFCLASLLGKINAKKILKVSTGIFILLCIYYNLWLTHQAHRGGLYKAGEMNAAYLNAIIGRYHVSKDVESLLDNEEVYHGSAKQQTLFMLENDSIIYITTENPSSPEYFFNPATGIKWIRATAEIYTPQKEWDTWKMSQFSIKFYHNNSIVKTNFIRINRLLSDGEKRKISFDASVPSNAERISVSFWNAGSLQPVLIREISVAGFPQ